MPATVVACQCVPARSLAQLLEKYFPPDQYSLLPGEPMRIEALEAEMVSLETATSIVVEALEAQSGLVAIVLCDGCDTVRSRLKDHVAHRRAHISCAFGNIQRLADESHTKLRCRAFLARGRHSWDISRHELPRTGVTTRNARRPGRRQSRQVTSPPRPRLGARRRAGARAF